MHRIMKNLQPNNHTPEIHRQHGDIKERRRREPKEQRGKTIKKRKTQRIPREISAHGTIPDRAAERRTVEDPRLRAVDDQRVQRHLAEHFVHGPFADEVFFDGIGEAVESRAEEGEEVAF